MPGNGRLAAPRKLPKVADAENHRDALVTAKGPPARRQMRKVSDPPPRHRRKMPAPRRGGEERSHLSTPLREGRRAAKSHGMILERLPLDAEHVAIRRLDGPAQFMREI